MSRYKATILDYSYYPHFTADTLVDLQNLLSKVVDAFDNHLFILLDNQIVNQFPITMHVADYIEKQGLWLIDEWIWLTYQEKTTPYTQLYKSILWVGKNNNYVFNKDLLRVEYIWKDMEWGKREKNYHPLGKDPGNVWLVEKAEKAVITAQNFIPFAEIISTLLCSQVTTMNEKFLVYSTKPVAIQTIIDYVKVKTGLTIDLQHEKI